MPSPTVAFNHGVASGDPYSNSVILWTRLSPPQGFNDPISVSWQASLSPGFETGSIVDSGTFSTSAARDWTVKVEADGLRADTTYYYRFLVDNVQSTVGQTKTLPVGGDPVRLAVFSCANFTAEEAFEAYGRAAAIDAVNSYDALVHLGDYIYEYGPGGYASAESAAAERGFLPNKEITSLDDYRQRYAQYHTDRNLQTLRAAAPLIAIWDDHETANDSWSGGAQNHQSGEGDWIARRDAALKAYYEWLPIREPLLRQGVDKGDANTGLAQGYRSFNFGDVLDLHVLETRLTARDEQLDYPDAAAVGARITAILTNPTELVAYATKVGRTVPTDPAAIPAFAAALAPDLAPLVTQELVIAAVQLAWGDPSRDLIGDTQLAWLQNQMGQSKAAWQVLGQQVLMQSMAVPAELLLNAGNLSLLDKYAAPLQKLATGTAFAELSAGEQALFAEAGKIPYNLDAWDGYGVERETILQTALAQGKRLISLAGDTHNAWAGVLDTMAPGSKPAGTVAGVEFATPGVTSPGLEKYFPGADGYLRSKYPSVDGLDGLFRGYVSGLEYADLNRRGFLDLTITADEARGSYQLLGSVDPNSGVSQWSTETVVATRDLNLSVNQLMGWDPAWRELDLVLGVALDKGGNPTRLNPESYASVPRAGVQLADITVVGSQGSDRIFAGVGSLVDAAGGGDELFNTESQGGNQLIGGLGSDDFYLDAAKDVVIGGRLVSDASGPRASIPFPKAAVVDQTADHFYILSDPTSSTNRLSILDFEIGIDQAFIDGKPVSENWQKAKSDLLNAGIEINAAPILNSQSTPASITFVPGVNIFISPSSAYAQDPDGDRLSLIVLRGPDWISNEGSSISVKTPRNLKAEDLQTLDLELGLYDGKAIVPYRPRLAFQAAPPQVDTGSPLVVIKPNGDIKNLNIARFGGAFNSDKSPQLNEVVNKVNSSDASYSEHVTSAGVSLADRALDFEADVEEQLSSFSIGVDLSAFVNTLPTISKHLTYYSIDSQGKVAPLTYNPLKGGGARFYDRNGDTEADFVSLKLIDGGYGDKDGTVNGTIVDPSTVGTAELDPVLQIGALSILKASDPTNTTAAASFFLRATLEALPSTANQIGYLVLEESQVASADSLDLATIRRQSQILFSTLENNDLVLPSGTTFTKDILLLNNQSVRFFEVVDGTLDQSDPRLNFFSGSLRNQSSSQFSSVSGVRFILDLQTSNQGLSAMIGQEQGTAAVLDFTAFSATETVRGTLHMGREANYDSVIGFYRTVDASGSVRTATGSILRPEDVGYSSAAIRTDNRVDSLSGLSVGNKLTSSKDITLSETTFLAPFAQVNGNTFFGFAAANTDRISHFRMLGTNMFGLEDFLGGGDRDFDDNVMVFRFDTVA